MPRVQRTWWVFLMSLVFPVWAWAAAAETITISTTVVGPTVTLCQVGATQTGAFIQILEQPVWYTLHSATATPGPTVGGFAPANTILTVRNATEFRAVRQGAVDSRAYIVCLPQ